MQLTRRQVLGSAGAAMMLAPLPARALQPTAGAFDEIAPRVAAFAEKVLAQNGFPGMAISLVGAGGRSAAFAVGMADLDSQTPATADQLFQIGSITKSLTAMTLFALAARGRVDLGAKVQDLLPGVPLPRESITLVQLLEHSSGLPNSLEPTPFLDVPGGRLWTGFTPGSHYSYCNLGYTLLGLVIEQAANMPFSEALQTLVLRPIGMASAVPVIRAEDRAAFATGHVRLREERPWLPRAALTEARWMDVHTAAGSVGASAHDMVHYLERLVALGRGAGAPLFPDALAQRFRTGTIASSQAPGARYGNGLVTLDVGGRPCFRHTGGMIGFSSAITVDPAAGVGCYASVNVGGAGGYRPIEVTEYALALLRAAASGQALPPAPEPQGPRAVPEPERFAGRWVGPGGREFVVAADAATITSGGIARPLAVAGAAALATDHPSLAPYVLALEPGAPPRLRLGATLFGRDAAPAQPRPAPQLALLAGRYYSAGAWDQDLWVFAVGDRLILGNDPVVPNADGSWRFTDAEGASERIWFQDPIAGRRQTLNLSGTRYSRVG